MHLLSRRSGGDEFRNRFGDVLLRLAIADRRLIEAGSRRDEHAMTLAEHRPKTRGSRRLPACAMQEDDDLAAVASRAILEFDAAGVDESIGDAHRSDLPRRRHHFFGEELDRAPLLIGRAAPVEDEIEHAAADLLIE